MGQIEAILGSTSAIAGVDPALAIMLGISGSLNSDRVGLGDVVVSNQAKLYSSDKVASLLPPDGKAPRYKVCEAKTVVLPDRDGLILVDSRDKFLKNSFLRYERNIVASEPTDRIISQTENFLKKQKLDPLDVNLLSPRFAAMASSQRDRTIHMGWVLGSHEVVDSEEYRDYLVAKNTDLNLDVHKQKGEAARVPWVEGDLLAVDMESYGLLRSAEMMRKAHASDGGCENLIGGIVVRGISDLCIEKSDMDENSGKALRKLAVENATNVCLALIEAIDYSQI
jgi:nucleoside phosphorylase